ncbi:hypothetical protein I5G87_gp76 [Mycobacterium phage Ekdilam]|uniref:Uncharacterized protein n=1 Tax=Mycobacterium phage Ekdilam TaxID=2599862 RepID=A0A5J6TL82_9CAUD|nr:hypothetical protein I5G87_gp76 [Mycobacterium phage Ekdilam]QFG11500.1 hypothetical protein PBI_EKDILAM_76 [Mycobacterium phage Ekdilam]
MVSYLHARDISDVRMLRAIDEGQRVMFGVAMRCDVTRILGGLAADAPVPSDEVPGVPWKVVLAKFRRVEGRGLARGCDCGCRGDWELTDAGRRLVELSRCTASPCLLHREHADRAPRGGRVVMVVR